MADKILQDKRQLFINSVTQGMINGLLDELLQKRVLNQEEMETIKAQNVTTMEKARNLIDSTIKKGPKACGILITYTCNEDCFLAEKVGLSPALQPESHLSAGSSLGGHLPLSAIKEDPNKGDGPSLEPSGSLKLCPLEVAQRIRKERGSEMYPISDKLTRTRIALIICNTEFDHLPRRAGADVDCQGMEALLQGLGYTVDVKQNLTATEMTTELKAFAARSEHKASDSTFLVFMSHGIPEGICGKKFSEQVPDVLKVNTIFQMMNTRNCPNLKDKPKVIIIQACRGENEGMVWVKDSVGETGIKLSMDIEFEDDGIKKAHTEKDFIAFFSSTPDNVSWRHPVRGSLFIIELIKNIKEYAWSCDLEEIFRKVRFSFEQPQCKAQMPTTERVTLTKCFYLLPGH